MSNKASKQWRMKEKCDNCPFHEAGPGRQLRDSLNPGRFEEIADGLLNGEHFYCHKTTMKDEDWDEETDDYVGGGLVCAGSIEYQEQRGIQSQYMQIRERFEKMIAAKKNGGEA